MQGYYYFVSVLGDISVVCIGPLTNMAMALRKDKMFGQQLEKCYIMGGNYYGESVIE